MFRAKITLLKAFIFVIFGVTFIREVESRKYRKCVDSERCEKISLCETVNYNFTSLSVEDRKRYLTTTECSESPANSTDPMVCCLGYGTEIDVPDRTICGNSGSQIKILGGDDADIDEFRWMAVLEYRNQSSPEPVYHCSGSLIHQRYLLTAAHCLFINGLELVQVHLGKYDLNTHENCDKEGMCAHPTVTVAVEKIIAHEDHNGLHNDIGLIRLARKVYYTDYITPICLPSTVGLIPSNENTSLAISGWGKGARNSVKQRLFVPGNNFNECRNTFESYNDIQIDSTHVCAGGIENESACSGDSGGPLMAMVDGKYAIEGIIINGFDVCSLKRKVYDTPILFTRVSSFESWIKKKISS